MKEINWNFANFKECWKSLDGFQFPKEYNLPEDTQISKVKDFLNIFTEDLMPLGWTIQMKQQVRERLMDRLVGSDEEKSRLCALTVMLKFGFNNNLNIEISNKQQALDIVNWLINKETVRYSIYEVFSNELKEDEDVIVASLKQERDTNVVKIPEALWKKQKFVHQYIRAAYKLIEGITKKSLSDTSDFFAQDLFKHHVVEAPVFNEHLAIGLIIFMNQQEKIKCPLVIKSGEQALALIKFIKQESVNGTNFFRYCSKELKHNAEFVLQALDFDASIYTYLLEDMKSLQSVTEKYLSTSSQEHEVVRKVWSEIPESLQTPENAVLYLNNDNIDFDDIYMEDFLSENEECVVTLLKTRHKRDYSSQRRIINITKKFFRKKTTAEMLEICQTYGAQIPKVLLEHLEFEKTHYPMVENVLRERENANEEIDDYSPYLRQELLRKEFGDSKKSSNIKKI